MSKRLTLNAEKRKTIADVFKGHWESEDNPKRQAHLKAIENYNHARSITKSLAEKVVRAHQPMEDIETIRSMRAKYNSAGGELYEDNCFYFNQPIIKVDDEGREYESQNEEHVKFDLDDRDFARSYYRDEINAKGLDADYKLKINDDYSKRNPSYYDMESKVENFLGYGRRNDDTGNAVYHKDEWENDFKLDVIGTSYCHSRQFKVDEDTIKVFQMYNQSVENVKLTHQQLYNYVDNKMSKLRLGLKSYKYFDQAKSLADKLGIPLNESVLNESSSMALSIYSPENLASLLEDKVEQTRDEKIAIAKALMQQQQSVN
jgi:hypothetical protein